MNIELDITRECNFCCPSCNRLCDIYPKNPKSIMNLDEIKDIIQQINDSNIKLERFVIMGGEPSTHPDLCNICLYISQNLKVEVDNIYIKTNGSNNKYVYDCLKGTNVKFLRDEWSNNNKDTKKLKYSKHINIYDMDTLNYKDNYDDCIILIKDGINIYKFNNEIRYTFCSCASYISRLLQIENNFTFTTFKEILNCDKSLYYKNICPYCALYTKDYFRNYTGNKVSESDKISDCFKSGINYIKNHSEEYL